MRASRGTRRICRRLRGVCSSLRSAHSHRSTVGAQRRWTRSGHVGIADRARRRVCGCLGRKARARFRQPRGKRHRCDRRHSAGTERARRIAQSGQVPDRRRRCTRTSEYTARSRRAHRPDTAFGFTDRLASHLQATDDAEPGQVKHRLITAAGLLIPAALVLAPGAVSADVGLPALSVQTAANGGGQTYTLTLQVLALMTALTLLPAILLMLTAFTRLGRGPA